MFSQTPGSVSRTGRLGVAVTACALAAVAFPSVAAAQSSSESGSSLPAETGNASVDDLVGQLPEDIIVGGTALGSEGLRESGSGELVDTAQSVGEVTGSVAPLEMLGSTGGSAAASVASSGSVAGSTYTNPTGSLGSGTIGLGSAAIPEYIFPILSVNLAGGFFTALGERQEAGTLYPHELDFWHGVVEGSADGGTLVEAAAADVGAELPGALAGSIDAVQESALGDPYEENERRRAEAGAAAAAGEESGGDREGIDDDDTTDPAPTAEEAGAGQAGAEPADPAPSRAEPAPAAPAQAAPAQVAGGAAAPATLASTGVDTTTIGAAAAGTVLLGTILLLASRRRV